MKKTALFIFLIVAILTVLASASTKAVAEVNINIGINAPLPPLVIPGPPALVVIPGTYAYFAPDIDIELIFFQGYWYRPHSGRWYRSSDYKGHWVYVDPPNVIHQLPSDYRRTSHGHERFSYGQVKKNWRAWEAEKHWDKHEKHEMKESRKEEKQYYKEEKHRGKHGRGRHDD